MTLTLCLFILFLVRFGLLGKELLSRLTICSLCIFDYLSLHEKTRLMYPYIQIKHGYIPDLFAIN